MARIANKNIVKEVELIKNLCGSSKKRFSAFKKAIDKMETEEEKIQTLIGLVSFLGDLVKTKEYHLEDFAAEFFIEYGQLIAEWIQRRQTASQKIAICKGNKGITIDFFRTLYDMDIFGNATEREVAHMIKRCFDFGDCSRYIVRDFRRSKGINKTKSLEHIEKYFIVKKIA